MAFPALGMDGLTVDANFKITRRPPAVHSTSDFDVAGELVQDKLFRLNELRRVVSATTKLNVDGNFARHSRIDGTLLMI